MMRVRLLASVANDAAGAILELKDEKAERLIRTGYAEAAAPAPTSAKAKKE